VRLAAAYLYEMCPIGGFIVVSCPQVYPYHADPIDTLYRPTTTDLRRLFPERVRRVADAQVTCHRMAYYYNQQGLKRWQFALRLMIPLYRSANWLELARWCPRRARASCIVLQRVS
jgi:hypothetical protein